MQVNKSAGFWIRFTTRVLDFILFFAISTAILIAFLVRKTNLEFREPYLFYVWIIITIIILLIIFIVFPLLFKGKTPFMFLTRISIKFNQPENKFISILKRETFFSLAWIFILLLCMVVINHTLISRYISIKNISELKSFSNFEKLRIQLVISLSSIILLIQIIFAISTIVRAKKNSLYDQLSNSKTVWDNRYITISKGSQDVVIKPSIINNVEIEWEE